MFFEGIVGTLVNTSVIISVIQVLSLSIRIWVFEGTKRPTKIFCPEAYRFVASLADFPWCACETSLLAGIATVKLHVYIWPNRAGCFAGVSFINTIQRLACVRTYACHGSIFSIITRWTFLNTLSHFEVEICCAWCTHVISGTGSALLLAFMADVISDIVVVPYWTYCHAFLFCNVCIVGHRALIHTHVVVVSCICLDFRI